MLFIILRSASRGLLKPAAPRKVISPNDPPTRRKISYSVLVKARAFASSQKTKSFQENVITLCCQQPVIPKRSFANSRRQELLVAPAMLQSYITRFMSTVQQTLSSNAAKQTEDDKVAALLAEPTANKRVSIKACGSLYAELSKTKPILFSSAPHEGIQFEVTYFDSLGLIRNNDKKVVADPPVVCLLHGAPGQYGDYADLIYHLTRDGIRVIAPNFPDYSATFDHSFRHSPRERLEFLLEFFKAIDVKQVDLLGGHSSAVYTMFELLDHSKLSRDDSNRQIEIKSLGLFSTPSHVLPHNLAVTPFRLFTLKLFDYPLLRPFVMALILTFVKVQGIRNRVDKNKIENLLIAASAMGYSQHDKMADRLKLLPKYKIPAILIYGTRDRLITVDNFKQLEGDLGIKSDSQVKFYKSDGSVAKQVEQRHELVDVSRFESGGHYTFQKYSAQASEDILNFLSRRVFDNVKETTKL